DLYVRREAEPTTNVFDCRPYAGTSEESCEETGAGRYFIAIYGYETSAYTLTVTLTEGATGTAAFEVTTPSEDSPAPTNGISHESSAVLAGEEAHFGPFSAESAALEVTLSGTGDADLFVRRDSAPTVADYDCRPYLPDSEEICTLDGPGTFYVMVSGYTDSTFDLSVAY
ncbi:MAG: PPC domain-containing protein, partial [Myxococcota bacterium]|nr:PPC domain-containing protein [Myxococcota bacterium]